MSHIRLRTLTSVGLACLVIGGLCHAQAPRRGEPPVSEVLIFGDVAKSGIFEVRALPTVAEFAERAGGLSSGSANVRVVRGDVATAKVVWAALLSKGQPCDFHVEHGDMLVVHSLERLSGRRAASGAPQTIEVTVINSQTRPLIVTLEQGEAAVSEVLQHCKMDGREFRLIRTNPKSIPVQARPDTVLEHGDIVMVGNAPAVRMAGMTQESDPQPDNSATAAKEPGALLIPVSEQTITPKIAPPTINDDTAPIPVEANYGAVDTTPPAEPMRPAPGQGIASPEPPTGFTHPSQASADGGTFDPLNTDPWLHGKATPPAPATTVPQNSFEAQGGIPPFNPPPSQFNANPQYPDGYNSQSYGSNTGNLAMPPQTPGLPGAQAGLPPRPPEGQATSTEGTATSSLPLPSELDAVVEQSGSNSTMWYVAGLAGALFLVLGAWVYGSRAMAETPQVRQDPYKRPVSRRHSTTVKHPPVASSSNPTPPQPTAEVQKPKTPTIKPITAPANPVPAATVSTVATQPAPMSEPVPHQPMPRPQQAPAAQPAPALHVPISIHAVQPTVAPAAIPAQPQPSVAAQSVPAVSEPEPIPVPNTSTTRILDALINNSIPVSEQPVQLPVHLEFFGDSSGPKQLRIDPAQALRGPHTAVQAGLVQRQKSASSRALND